MVSVPDTLKPKQKAYTELQIKFLAALIETKGNNREAARLAGYSDNTPMADIIGPLKEEILELSMHILAGDAVKAAMSYGEIIDKPDTIGANNKIAAANEILNRIGIIKKEEKPKEGPKQVIFLLPPKEPVDLTKIIDGDYRPVIQEEVGALSNG